MKTYNLILLYNTNGDILMCKRRKPPFQGLRNLVGGKVEPGEDSREAAYRELFEETGITADLVDLIRFMDSVYYYPEYRLEIYGGRLKCDADVSGEENELLWVDAKDDFSDTARYAGKGILRHIVEIYEEAISKNCFAQFRTDFAQNKE